MKDLKQEKCKHDANYHNGGFCFKCKKQKFYKDTPEAKQTEGWKEKFDKEFPLLGVHKRRVKAFITKTLDDERERCVEEIERHKYKGSTDDFVVQQVNLHLDTAVEAIRKLKLP